MAVPRLEYTLGGLGLFYVLVALVLPEGLAQAGVLLAGAVFSMGAVLVWVLRRRRRLRGEGKRGRRTVR